ncbi:MAG: hypothetical protein KA712_20380 [Myxococcales bacterium]|nr:hypothetical protein [Myxococcales bacterium]
MVKGKRHRLGRALDVRVAVASLEATWVPPRLRALLAAELGIVFGLSSAVDPDAPAPIQKSMLEHAAAEAQGRMGLPAGAWGVSRGV